MSKRSKEVTTEVVVLGAGPGGYTAAFRAADLGKKVTLVERHPTLGGVCLNVGCIPSKTLLHVADVLDQAEFLTTKGIDFNKPTIDKGKLVAWKNEVVSRLTSGLAGLAGQRKIEILHGTGAFISPYELLIENQEESIHLKFDSAIIAAGSRITKIADYPNDDPRLWDSTSALELPKIDGRLLIIGGGIIGLELATVYHSLGSSVNIASRGPLLNGVDTDLVKPLQKKISTIYENVYINTSVRSIEPSGDGLIANFDGKKTGSETYDNILVAVGRIPNSDCIGLETTQVQTNKDGYIEVKNTMQTSVEHIFAIGDIIGQPMLAHKASHQGKVAAEVIAGHKAAFDTQIIPSVAYTDPEIAWVGITETEAKQQGLDFAKGVFPWMANGRSLSLGRDEGLSKIIFDKQTNKVLGVGITGPHAGELMAECALAIEMGCDVQDIALTIHPHPTLSETIGMAAEICDGSITDLYVPRNNTL